MMLRADLHLHTWYSMDGYSSPREMALAAKRRGMNGFAITDHDTIAGYKEGRKIARELGMLFIPGEEVTTKEGVHILAIGIENLVPSKLTVPETIERIHDNGGVAVAAHPYDPVYGAMTNVRKYKYDGIEWRCSQNWISNILTELLLGDLPVARTGGTDSHYPGTVANAWTVFPDANSVDDIVAAIRKKKCFPGGACSFPHKILLGIGYSLIAIVKRSFNMWRKHFHRKL